MEPVYRRAVLAHTTLRDLATSPNAGDLLGVGVLQPPTPTQPLRPPTPSRPRFDILPPSSEGAGASSPAGAVVGTALGRALGTTAGVLVVGGVGVALGLTVAYFWR